MRYAAKLHHHGRVLAACDEDLLGKTFSEGKLKLTVKRDFYLEKLVSGEELKAMMEKAEILNLVGDGVIGVAKGLGMDVDAVLKIGNVSHLQVLKVQQNDR